MSTSTLDVNTMYLNINNFSEVIGEKISLPPESLKNYILANISLAIVRNTSMKKDINNIYTKDKEKYYLAAKNSSCINHIIITSGTLEQEIECRKALGVLLIAEEDFLLRNTIVKLLRKNYPFIYAAVKNHDKKPLISRYRKMDEFTRNIEYRLDEGIYFYFSIYRSMDAVDTGFIQSIIEDMKFFETCAPITRDTAAEIEKYKDEIQELKTYIKSKYGKFSNYKDILINNNSKLFSYGEILDNFFTINKLNINHLFANSEFINMDEILLAYAKRYGKKTDDSLLIFLIVSCIFIKSLINEYKKIRFLYSDSTKELLSFEIDKLNQINNNLIIENERLSSEVSLREKDNLHFDKKLNDETTKQNKLHLQEINILKNKIKELEKNLEENDLYKPELFRLREHIFKEKKYYSPLNEQKKLKEFIVDKKIIIIGGTKEWRRKFRDKYPEIRTLNGFNENFDPSLLSSYDFIFFYTGFMNHATYYKSMNFIRSNGIKFGYLGKTNLELVEQELIDELKVLL